ncbi:MAG: UrcA family protein [Phenylobacterium sp.]
MTLPLILCAATALHAGSATATPWPGLNLEPTPAGRSAHVQAVVSTKGVDFADLAQVTALHQLLASKAAWVCDSRNPRSLGAVASDRACARAALDRVVRDADRPLLTALHGGGPASMQLAVGEASAQPRR